MFVKIISFESAFSKLAPEQKRAVETVLRAESAVSKSEDALNKLYAQLSTTANVVVYKALEEIRSKTISPWRASSWIDDRQTMVLQHILRAEYAGKSEGEKKRLYAQLSTTANAVVFRALKEVSNRAIPFRNALLCLNSQQVRAVRIVLRAEYKGASDKDKNRMYAPLSVMATIVVHKALRETKSRRMEFLRKKGIENQFENMKARLKKLSIDSMTARRHSLPRLRTIFRRPAAPSTNLGRPAYYPHER